MSPKTRARKTRKWSHKVKTVSTFPPPGTFTKPGPQVAEIMASKKVSPRGLGSAIRMIQFFINRAGRMLKPKRKAELERAKQILQRRRAQSDG
jgi:Protein of unknown function (DUF3175)